MEKKVITVAAIGLELTFVVLSLIPWWARETSLPPLTSRGLSILATSVIGSLLIYGAMFLFCRRRQVLRVSSRMIYGWLAVFLLTLVLLPPIGSADVYNYILRVREWTVYGLNLYTVPATAIAHDVFSLYAPQQWVDNTVNYGPLWTLLMIPVELVSRPSIFATVFGFRLVSVAAFLGSVWLVSDIAKRTVPALRYHVTLFYAWNPFVLFEVANNGHNDILMVFFVLAAVWCAVTGRDRLILPLIVCSALIKFISLLLVPFACLFLWKKYLHARVGRMGIVTSALAALIIAIIAYAPFWEGRETFSGILTQGSYFNIFFQSPLPFVVLLVLKRVGIAAFEDIQRMAFGIGLGTFLVWYGIVFWKSLYVRFFLLDAWARIVMFYLLVASFLFAPWFILWFIPFGFLSMNRHYHSWAIIASMIAFFSYIMNFFSLNILVGVVIIGGMHAVRNLRFFRRIQLSFYEKNNFF